MIKISCHSDLKQINKTIQFLQRIMNVHMKKYCLLLCLLCFSIITYSQTRRITGLVTKLNSYDTLTAVSVTVKGTSTATSYKC